MQRRAFKLLAAIAVLMFVAGGVARAGTKNYKGRASGTTVAVPIDLDGDSCFAAANGATVCTDTSGYNNYGGMRSPGGSFTGQSVGESDFVPGTSCNIGGNIVPGIASCTLAGTSEQGCELQGVVGGAGVDRDNASGDLLFLAGSSGTLCVDLSSGPPFNFTGSTNSTITGGTGKNAGATGVEAFTFHGQGLSVDPAGNGLSWFEGSTTGTITTP